MSAQYIEATKKGYAVFAGGDLGHRLGALCAVPVGTGVARSYRCAACRRDASYSVERFHSCRLDGLEN
jgi:hypothetical protein